jgi:hypothetical protein
MQASAQQIGYGLLRAISGGSFRDDFTLVFVAAK